MKKILSDLVRISQGVNSSRLTEVEKSNLYAQIDFESDLLKASSPNPYQEQTPTKNGLAQSGEILINTMKQQATVVSPENDGKIVSMNFLKVEFLTDQLDKGFFVYLFNENREMRRQKEREIQGGTAFVQKIPLSSLKQLEVQLPNLKKQKQIGRAYANMQRLKQFYLRQANENERLTLEILEKSMGE